MFAFVFQNIVEHKKKEPNIRLRYNEILITGMIELIRRMFFLALALLISPCEV